MKKEQFFELLDKCFGNCTLEELVDFCNKAKWYWINDYLDTHLAGKEYCPRCGKYSDKEKFNMVQEKEILVEMEPEHVNGFACGNRYEQEYEVLFEYRCCPVCNHKIRVREISRRGVRWS